MCGSSPLIKVLQLHVWEFCVDSRTRIEVLYYFNYTYRSSWKLLRLASQTTSSSSSKRVVQRQVMESAMCSAQQQGRPSSQKDTLLWRPWPQRPVLATQAAVDDDRSSWTRVIHPPSASRVTGSRWWLWQDSSDGLTECDLRTDNMASSAFSAGRQVQAQKVSTMRDGQHNERQSSSSGWCQPKSWNPFLSEAPVIGRVSPSLSLSCQPLTLCPQQSHPPKSSPSSRASPWSTSPSSSSSSSAGSSPEKQDRREAQVKPVHWDLYGAHTQSPTWPPHHQISKACGEKQEPDRLGCSVGSSLQDNLERNVRWLTNSQLHPVPPSRLSAPRSCLRRRPILGSASTAIAQTQPSFQQMSYPRAASPAPASPPAQRFIQRQQMNMGSKTTREAIMCTFCRKNGETREFYTTHKLKDCWGRVICPVLRAYVCPNCGLSGDNAHTVRHCPYNQ